MMKSRKSSLALLFTASLALFSSCQDTDLATVQTAFENASIPEDANLNFDPTVLFEVIFPQASGSSVNVTAGVPLARNAMIDLDVPTPQDPTSAQIRHFLGGDFVAGQPDAGELSLLSNSTAALSGYQQPTPPAGSDPHRYVFLLFNQSAAFNDQTQVNATTSIANFNISQFALDVGLGDPLGGTFILVGPDPTS